MAQHNQTGKEGEEEAVEFLKKKGYEILETNWRFDRAEIDIIAQFESLIIGVEVKTRTNLDYGLPQEFVKTGKVKNLVKALNAYIELNEIDLDVRFDIIAIYREGNRFEIEHLEDAFYHF